MRRFLLVGFISFIFLSDSFAQRAKNGNATISASNTIVNEYAVLTADAIVGNLSITVDNNTLNTNNRFSAALSQGDLIMIIQVQGASISGTTFVDGSGNTFGLPKDSTWGGISSYNNCGNYELAEVFGVSGTNNIQLVCALQKDYTAPGKVQVVRMPRYDNLTVNNTASITCDPWNGSKGGIIAIEVNGTTTISGAISASGRGFRGGVADNQSSFGSNDVACTSGVLGAEKGESIAGFQNDYNVVGGRYCKGAPANGGGGGNMHNGGGGGGGNGGNPLLWLAVGNPSLSTAAWANAWNLEIPGFAALTSTGGGKGGYTASTNNQNALAVGPNVGSWGGDNRNKQGGYGGRPLNYTNDKIFFGGGGGAGDGNDGYSGAGGAAGGLIFINSYGPIGGTGTIVSNGNNGVNAFGNAPLNGIAGKDGAGGGGAGGTIFIKTTGVISGISLAANGGDGGDQLLTRGFLAPSIVEAHGPGGGGGGGYINTTTPIAATANGGIYGTTDSPSLSEFTPNGATTGGNGTITNTLPAFDILLNNTSVCSGGTVTLTASIIGTLPSGAVLGWYDAAYGGNLLGTGNSFTTPPITSNTTFYVGFCPSTFLKPVNVTTTAGVTASVAGVNQVICQNNTTLAANNPTVGTGAWSVISGTASFANSTQFNTTVSNLSVGANILEWTISEPGCPPSQSQVTITVTSAPIADAGVDQQICSETTTLAAVGTGTWTFIAGSGNINNPNSPNSQVNNLAAGLNTLLWTVNSAGCPPAEDTVDVLVSTPPSTADAGNNQQLCGTLATLNAVVPTVGTGAWSLVSGAGNIVNASNNNTEVNGLIIGNNIFEWSVSTPGCPPSTDQVTITINGFPPLSNAGTDQTLCTSGTTLAANLPTTGTSGTWTLAGGSATFSNINSNTSLVSNLGVGSNTLVWTVTDPACPAVADTVVITVASALSVADAGADQQVCSSDATLNAVLPLVGNGTWTLISGAGSVQSANSNNSVVTGLASGVNVFEWTVSGAGCPSNSDQVSITVNLLNALADAGSNTSVCGNAFNLNANTPTTGLTGTWSSNQAGILFSNINNPNAQVSNLQVGFNELIWTVNNTVGCPAVADTVVITSVASPSNASAGSDANICNASATLNANVPATGTGLWSILSGSGTLSNPGQANTVINGLTPGNTTLIWTISNAPCAAQTDTLVLTTLPALSPAVAGNDTNLCATQFTLSAIVPLSGVGTWTVVSGAANISDANAPNATLTNLGNGVNTLQWTISNGICPDVSDQITINVFTPPSVAVAGADVQTCVQSTEITATAPTSGIGSWSVSQGSAAISSPNSPSTSVVILSPGGATFTWQVSSGACPSTSDDLVVTLLSGSDAADAGSDVTIALGDSTILNASGGTVNGWDPPNGLSCIDCPNPVASPDTTTMYYLLITDDNGCKSTDSVLVTVDESAGWYLPNAFTPDNNGVNDLLYFYGTGVKEFVLRVYDRWGELVFETSDFKNAWDGTFKNKPVTSGVYAYQLTITFKSSKVEEVSGNINLIRN